MHATKYADMRICAACTLVCTTPLLHLYYLSRDATTMPRDFQPTCTCTCRYNAGTHAGTHRGTCTKVALTARRDELLERCTFIRTTYLNGHRDEHCQDGRTDAYRISPGELVPCDAPPVVHTCSAHAHAHAACTCTCHAHEHEHDVHVERRPPADDIWRHAAGCYRAAADT